jgi:cell division transport system permease protein
MTDAATDAERLQKLQAAAQRRQARLAAQRPNQLVPENTVSANALTVVIAIMSFLACLTLGAVTLVRDASRDWQADVEREVTIQVLPIDGADTAAETARAAAIARKIPGIASVQVLDNDATARLLEPWLGSGLDLSALPVPRLIVIKLVRPGAADLTMLGARLKAEVRGASLDNHAGWVARLQSMANVTVFAGLTILALVFLATVLSVVFATRGAMAVNSGVVSVLHIVGAEDGFIAREFQRHFLLLGLRGGLIGAAAAAFLFATLTFVVVPAIGGADGQQVSALFGRFAVGPIGYFGALGIAFLVAVMTALTSRLTVYRSRAEADCPACRLPFFAARLGQMSDVLPNHAGGPAIATGSPVVRLLRMRRLMKLTRAVVVLAGLAGIALAAGFVAFAASVAGTPPPGDVRAEGIVVFTGGTARIDSALRLLAEGRGKRLLISGVNPSVGLKALAGTVDEDLEMALACCVDLGRDARDTIGNAAETRDWAKEKGYTSLIVVTSDYHMPRSMAELAPAMPEVNLIPYPVSNPELHLGEWWSNASAFALLLREYGKYLLATGRVRISGTAASPADG